MRTEWTASFASVGNVPVLDLTARLLKDVDWFAPADDAVSADGLREYYGRFDEALRRRGGRPPVEPHDEIFAELLGPDDDPLSRRRLIIQNSLLLLAQLPKQERDNALPTEFFPVYHGGYEAYGLIFRAHDRQVKIRLRQSDPQRLREGTAAVCAAFGSRRQLGNVAVPLVVSRGNTSTAVETRQAEGTLRTTFSQILMFTALNEPTHRGTVQQFGSSWGLWWYAFWRRDSKALLGLGAAFTAASAALYFIFGSEHGAGPWFEGLFGRLATAAFGAQFVGTATEAATLGGMSRDGQHGVHVSWDTP